MRSLTDAEIESVLAGPHQAVLSISRADRGPLAVPMSFLYVNGVFRMITSPDSQHGALMVPKGRASMTVHHDQVLDRSVEQWYVTAEGPIEFTDEDPQPLLRAILRKDRGSDSVDEWLNQSMRNVGTVAVLTPERVAGYIGVSRLD